MIRKLKVKFIVINMGLVLTVLLVMFGLVYGITSRDLREESVRMLRTVAAEPMRMWRPGDRDDRIQLPYFVLQFSPDGSLAPEGFRDSGERTLKVATKFANIARRFYAEQGRDIDIIPLNGSIELAPLLGLSDVIVDIVETGTTLRENRLEVVETILPISARLIANQASWRFKADLLVPLVRKLEGTVKAND